MAERTGLEPACDFRRDGLASRFLTNSEHLSKNHRVGRPLTCTFGRTNPTCYNSKSIDGRSDATRTHTINTLNVAPLPFGLHSH